MAGERLGWRTGGKGGGEGEGGEVEGREREAPKLLLKQGPSETCYASVTSSQILMLPVNIVFTM